MGDISGSKAKKREGKAPRNTKLRAANNLVKFYKDENKDLAIKLKAALVKIDELNKFEKFIMLKRELYSDLERRLRESEWNQTLIKDELVKELSEEQLEAAKVAHCAPERYALEWFKILKYERDNVMRRLRDGSI